VTARCAGFLVAAVLAAVVSCPITPTMHAVAGPPPAAVLTAVADIGGGDASGAPFRAPRSATVGQLRTDRTSCTATVVESRSGGVAVTAAHCVHRPARSPLELPPGAAGPLAVTGFTPGRDGDRAPFGSWPVERVEVDPRWVGSGDPAHDVAFLRLGEVDGRTVQEVVGAQRIAFGAVAAGTPMTALGYPAAAPFDGRTLRRCTSPGVAVSRAAFGALQMRCAMTPGVSGGPWLSGFDPATGAGTVSAVTSFVDESNGLLSAVTFRPPARTLFDAADR
jgi:V8-like Glu-specific endopeptidase